MCRSMNLGGKAATRRALSGRKVAATRVTLWDAKGKVYWKRTWDYESADAIAAVKMFLPNGKLEYCARPKKGADHKVYGTSHTDRDGKFEFPAVAARDAYLKISIEHKDGAVTKFVGFKNLPEEWGFGVKKDEVIWGRVKLPADKFPKSSRVADLGEVEVTHSDFRDVCDAYHSLVFGHRRLKALTGEDLPFVETRFPQKGTTSFYWKKTMWITPQRARKRSTLLHEFAHYIFDHKLGSHPTRGYGYNDDAEESHGPDSKEYLDAAWEEGAATFVGQALADTPKYYSTFGMDLDKDESTIGAHNESSIQGALWHAYKKHGASFKDDVWKVLTDKRTRTVTTAWDFWDSWRSLRGAKIGVLKKAYKTHAMDYRYRFLTGKEMHKAVKAPAAGAKSMKKSGREFTTIQQLHGWYGAAGGGTEADYVEEFYNENNYANSASLGSGSSLADPKVVVGNKYVVPVREENT